MGALSLGGRRHKEGFHRSTFIIEAMLLFVCLMIIVALSISTFAFSSGLGRDASYKERAIVLATNTAESFMADPLAVSANQEIDGFSVECSVAATVDDIGSMYGAFISVRHENDVIYTLNVSRYISHTDRGEVR